MTKAATDRARSAAIFALRVTAAALLALWIAQIAKVRLPLWVVLTALALCQTSLGRSLKATFDYMAGTLSGALWAALVTYAVPQTGEASLLLTLAIALAPLAAAASYDPRFIAAPITAAIVTLIPQITHATPLASALERVLEVSLGGAVGLFVSYVMLPTSAFRHTRELASQSLDHMATALQELIGGLGRGLDTAETHRIQDGLGAELARLAAAGGEAEHERRLRWGADPLTSPLLRTLLRLRHDLVMVGRAAGAPLPDHIREALEPPLAGVGSAIGDHMRLCGTALQSHRGAPLNTPVDGALRTFTAAIDRLREASAFRTLPSESVERVFAIGFALEQVRRNLHDLDRCVDDWARMRS